MAKSTAPAGMSGLSGRWSTSRRTAGPAGPAGVNGQPLGKQRRAIGGGAAGGFLESGRLMGEALQDDHLPVGAQPPLHLPEPGVRRGQEAVIIGDGPGFPRLQAGLLLQGLGQGRHDEALPGMVSQPLLLGVRFGRSELGYPAPGHQVPPGPHRAILDGRPPAPHRFNAQGVGGCRLFGRAGDAAGQQSRAGQGLALEGKVRADGASLERAGNPGVDLSGYPVKGPGRGLMVLAQ